MQNNCPKLDRSFVVLLKNPKNNQLSTKNHDKMNTQNQNGYMLLFRGTDLRKGLSPEELQKVTDNWMAWFRRLTEQGKAIAGNPLEREGKIVSGQRSDRLRWTIRRIQGSHWWLFSSRCRHDERSACHREGMSRFALGIRVEVRPVAGECPIAAEVRAEAQFAQI